jgi:hypothetical protein
VNKLILAAAVAAIAATAIPSAFAGTTLQGPQLTGVALQSLVSGRPAVTAVRLASGETIGLNRHAANRTIER